MDNKFIEEVKQKSNEELIENQTTSKSWDLFNVKWKQNIVTDVNAPLLYSRQVINAFSILFSVLFGGILLAINLNTINNKKAILPVLLFSVGYIGLMIFILPDITGLSLAFNIVGATVLYNYFWGKYIGREFQYRTKPFWIPLIIGILITVFFIWAMIVENEI